MLNELVKREKIFKLKVNKRARVLVAAVVYAQGTLPVGESPNFLCDLATIFGNVLNAVVALASIALFTMLVWGGMRYLSSGGDPKSTEQAKGIITFAIIGMALLLISWVVLRFLEEFTGINLTRFRLPCPSDTPIPYFFELD